MQVGQVYLPDVFEQEFLLLAPKLSLASRGCLVKYLLVSIFDHIPI